jgi:uncharacterized membrane protein
MTQLDQPMSQSSPDTLVDRWSNETQAQRDDGINVGGDERTLSIVGGTVLAALGLSRRSIPGTILALVGGGLIYRGVTGKCEVYRALGRDTSGRGATPEDFFQRSIHIEEAVTIDRTPWDLYAFWRNFENLPSIMSHLESVRCEGDRRSHWVAKAPAVAGGKVEWDAEVINDEPNALIAWRSLPGADVDNAGSVRFIPSERGTIVKVVIDYIPPAGKVGSWIASLFGEEPSQQIHEDLRRFKRSTEVGEVLTTKGQPRGSCLGSGKREE